MTRRRIFLLAAVAAPSASLLAACGFALRRAPELRFKTIQLVGFKPRSPLAEELRMNLNASTTTRVVESAAQAEVVLEAIDDVREKAVVGSTAAGQVTEFSVRGRFKFRVRGVGGKELIPATELSLNRDMTYTERDALGKEQEETFLYRAMQSDIVAQVMRRLASIQNF
ncbi:MAG TPA: LPS assembly lipoprotein LptE [Burkholderiaceae bacterium]|nr:LPS assembly lipoprotein LptE [Burkholderiaceae bacterium]